MFVVVGVPCDVSEPREYVSSYGVHRSVTFALSHPDVPAGDGSWVDRFSAEGDMIEEVQAAAAAGKPVHLLMRTFKRKGGKDGVWYLTVAQAIVKAV